MKPALALFALLCLPAMALAGSPFDQLAQAAPAAVSSQCSCGPDCPCSQEALEKYQTYKLYHDRMEEWLKSQGHRATSRVVQTATPVVPYTGGAYTRGMSRGGFLRGRFFGGSCANGQCGQ